MFVVIDERLKLAAFNPPYFTDVLPLFPDFKKKTRKSEKC